jgi:hypothetical protein
MAAPSWTEAVRRCIEGQSAAPTLVMGGGGWATYGAGQWWCLEGRRRQGDGQSGPVPAPRVPVSNWVTSGGDDTFQGIC